MEPLQLKRCGVCLACVLGIALWLIIFRTGIVLPDAVEDFTGFLVGARLLGTSNLYTVSANLLAQKAMAGRSFAGVIYVRPPFFAAAFLPFLHLPYLYAVVVWKLLMIAALAAFVVLFPVTPRRYTAVALCWSLPAAMGVWRANDAPVMLLLIAASPVLWRRRRALEAGMVLGVCLVKFHFLLFVPLLLLQPRYRRVLAGFAVTTAALLLVNFSVQPNWLRLYWQLWRMPQENMNAMPDLMPNFYASFFWTGHPAVAVAFGACLLAFLLFPLCRRLPFEVAMPLTVYGGLLVAPHTNGLDAILAIPALLMTAIDNLELRKVAFLLLSPLAACLYCLGPRGFGPLIFVCTSVWLIRRAGRIANSAAEPNCGVADAVSQVG
jgi:hypothetical protein